MPGLAPYIRTLNANQRTTIEARGTTVFLRQASGEISVTVRSTRVGTGTGVAYSLRMTAAEKWFHAEEFDSVEIQDETGAPNTVEFYIGFGDFEKPVPDIVNVQVSSPASASVNTIADKINIDVDNAGKEQLLPVNLNRINAWITSLAGNTDNIRLGDTNVGIARGTQLQPGDTILWSSKAACFACSEAVVNQAVSITEFVV